jgi:hypothetical protein
MSDATAKTSAQSQAPSPAAPSARKVLIAPIFRRLIGALLRTKAARNYLEVGVRAGETVAEATCPAVGVDPNLSLFVRP